MDTNLTVQTIHAIAGGTASAWVRTSRELRAVLVARAQLADAIQQRDAARIQFHTATTRKARLAADEDLNFWVGKVAMLTAIVNAL